MRYFITTVADRPVRVGGREFHFEPVALRGGSWLGVLAVEEDSAANTLASGENPSVGEISKEKYDDEKKKLASSTATSTGFPTPQPISQPALSVAGPAGLSTSPISAPGSGPGQPVTAQHGDGPLTTAVTLLTTNQQPPMDPMFAPVEKKFRA